MNFPIDQLLRAAASEDVLQKMGRFYADLDRDIAAQPGTCWMKSTCCRFGPDTHRLYVTALEVAYYLARRRPGLADGETCPHLDNGLCGIREDRLLGCRVFLCDPIAQEWQGPLTEKYLERLKRMHEELDVPYFYADWLHVLGAIRAYDR
ncbi:MAG: hypothetical protein ACYTHJ_17395 [Planctomycetota bacterium]